MTRSPARPVSDSLTQPADPIALFARDDVHGASGLGADVHLAGDDPLHAWALDEARILAIAGTPVPFAPPEYVLVRKLECLRNGGSDKHLSGIRAMLARSEANMNLGLLSDLVRQRGLDELWTRARR